MIKIEKTNVMGFEQAIRGMRNPMNSWDKSDGYIQCVEYDKLSDDKNKTYLIDEYSVGPNDHELMMKLVKGGPVHAKFRRMIAVYVDITAPLYWWKEFDTYKVGTVANSCSTMHKIAEKPFVVEDFSNEHIIRDWVTDGNDEAFFFEDNKLIAEGKNYAYSPFDGLQLIIALLNTNRDAYLKTKDKKYWWQMIQLLPSSYNQKRTIMLNYEVLAGIYEHRKNRKLDEWKEFCKWIEGLPYSEIIYEQDV